MMNLYIKKRKRFLKQFFVGSVLFSLGALLLFTLSLISSHIPLTPWVVHPFFSLFLVTLVFILAYKPVDLVMTQLFRNYLFKNKSYCHMTLMNLADELSVILDLKEAANLIVNTFGEVLHLKTVALVLPNRIRSDFEVVSAFGWHVSDARKIRFSRESPIMKLVRKSGPHVQVRDRVVRTLSWPDANQLAYDFDSLRASWIVPLFVKEELVGLMAFSSESPDSIFDEADFQLFREFSRHVAKYLRNALSVYELTLANDKLQDVQSQLLQTTKLAAIEQLATGIAHEIHNPLTIISGKAQVLLLQKDRNQLDQRVEEVLKTIVKQTKRAADITRKLLMFSQGSVSLKEMVDLEQVLEDTISLVSYQTSLDGIEIEKIVKNPVPPLYANVHEMREIFFNLILNAVQSIGTKGKISIEIKNRSEDELIEILVSDSGEGISPEHLEKLFNPFFTTRTDSVGLGLFITKQIVHRYGGSIRAQSHIGKGSFFILHFPYLGPGGQLISEKGMSLSLFPVRST